jgi:hypothetical protein
MRVVGRRGTPPVLNERDELIMIISSRMRRAWVIAVCASAVGLAGVVSAAAPADAAGARSSASGTVVSLVHSGRVAPFTFTQCTFGSSGGNTQTCEEVVGSGLHITTAVASAHVVSSARTLDVCMVGPPAVGTIGCTGWVLVDPGSTLLLTWSPNRNEPAGNYCAETFRLNSDGTVTLIGEACVDVHA